jgi:hypothetical protein
LYPSHRVFVDGRSDFYGNAFEDKYVAGVISVRHGWEETLDCFGVDTILMPPDAALTGALKESRRWTVVYDDGIAVVFRSTSRTAGEANSATAEGAGTGRDREITKLRAANSPWPIPLPASVVDCEDAVGQPILAGDSLSVSPAGWKAGFGQDCPPPESGI